MERTRAWATRGGLEHEGNARREQQGIRQRLPGLPFPLGRGQGFSTEALPEAEPSQ
jgi:hypothetical protein